MADHETDMSKAEQRSAAVERLRRAASLPRMKDGRRPPMHVEAVSEGERAQGEEERGGTEADKTSDEAQMSSNERENEMDALESKTSDPDSDHLPIPTQKPVDVDVEADTELEERPLSPTTAFKKRRSRSRSRSRGSKDFKGKFKPPQSPAPQIAGDSSPDEKPPLPPPALVPMVPPLLSPVPHFPFLQQSRFLRSPGPVTPEMALFYPGTSPSTPLPTLEDLQRGLIRSNSAGSAAAAGRRMAMHKLTGGTETYDPPSSSPTPPPSVPKLSRNNTVSGGERIAARQNMLNRLNPRIAKKEVDAEAVSSAEDRSAISPSPTAKRRRRRSRKSSTAPNPNITISDSEFNSTAGDTLTPVTPHAAAQEQYVELRAQSATPNQLSSSRNQSHERPPLQDTSPPPLPVQSAVNAVDDVFKGQEQAHRRSVLVEDPEEDEEDRYVPTQRYTPSSGTPVHAFSNQENLRLYQHPSETSSNVLLDSRSPSSMGVPISYNQRAPSRNGLFTNSPFNVPLKERALSEEEEEDPEEQVLYPVPRVEPSLVEYDSQERILSWVASPVPEYRMPVDEDEDDEVQEIEVHMGPDEGGEDDAHLSPASHNQYLPDDGSSSSQSVVLEIEAARKHLNLYKPSSPGPVSQPPSVDGSVSPQFMPTRLSVASRIQSIGDRSPLTTEFSEWDEKYASADSSKREREPSSSPWEKAKNILSRASSRTGRRSRTNSIAARERREHNTDSSISRESGASLTTAKTDQGDVQNLVQVQAPPLMQSPSASASISSLAPHTPTRGNVSPIPPPSSSDMAKYQNAKLFPFPGMLKLEEERRAKNYILPSSNHDAGSQPYEEVQAATGYPFASTSTQASDINRERGPSREHSDQRLHAMYGTEQSVMTPGPSSHPEYINVSPPQQNGSSYNLKLPTTLPGVKQWLSKNSKKKTASPAGSVPGTVTLPLAEPQSTPITNKKPSISDIFSRKTNELADWEDSPEQLIVHDDSSPLKQLATASSGAGVDRVNVPERTQTPKGHQLPPLEFGSGRASPFKFPTGPSVNRLTAATPDPSSISEYPAPTASESSSTSSSLSSSSAARIRQIILDRLDEHISKTFRLEDTPRKLILSSPVLQVVNPNTVKDRFLFLFNDILIITKPVNFDQDSLVETYKLSLPDRKYAVKSVVQLRNVHFCADRSDAAKIQANSPRNALLRAFVSQFPKEPDQAIATLFTKSGLSDDPVLLGQLLFKTLDLDRSSLGEYLSRKTSKTVLKSYLDSFGFAGLRVDVALRVFLQSINVSRYSQSYAALELLLDAFASRWYEANAKFVAYDKDMAIRLIRGLAQLNERLHGSIADEPGPTDHIHRNVSSKEFVDAFRRHDMRYFVSDELLQDLYRSVYRERLCQATVSGSQETAITIKRPLPGRLIYKAQSDPIIFRLPQPDPGFTIALYGQDLTFDPPVLQFIKSSEASFRVTGTSLGTKSITMCRSGPNAIKYSGIPLSHTVVVERAFMRNTFQLAFLNHAEEKRRYMFSVDDPIIRNEWATSIRRHIDSSTVSSSTATGPSHDASKFRKAADAIAFKVLQDTLMGNYTPTHRLNGSYNSSISAIASQLGGPGIPISGSIHARSKSRSRVYRHGAGRNELDLPAGSSQDGNDFTGESSDHAHTPEQADGALWTARDLEVHCQQNSTIGQMLSYVQLSLAEGNPPFS